MSAKPAVQTKPVTVDEALANIAGQFPEECKALSLVVKKNIVALGTDEAFALRDQDGEIRAFKQTLTLSAGNGGLVQPVQGGPFVVSAQGYEMWAEAVGASVVCPKEVIDRGQFINNLTVVEDPSNKRILRVPARAVAWRFTSKGLPQVVDWSTCYDVPAYRLIDLLAKAKKYPQAFRLYPKRMGAPEDPGTWTDYVFDESAILWVNTSHEEALSWYSQILNREKKAIDFAQTFARRNALKHLSGLQKAPGPSWTIPILSWRPTGNNIVKWDMTQYVALQEKAGSLMGSSGEDFTPGQVNAPKRMITKLGAENVSEDPGFDSMISDLDIVDAEFAAETLSDSQPGEPTQGTVTENPEPPPAEGPPPEKKAWKGPPTARNSEKWEHKEEKPAQEVPALSADELRVMANLDEAKQMFPQEYDSACKGLKIAPGAEHSVTQARAIMKEINRIVDSVN